MPPLLTTLGLGFLLGIQHALDPDHIIAISTIVSRNRRWWAALGAGVSWGIGHTATLFLVGMTILVSKTVIPESLALLMEFLVGVLLVILGASIVRTPIMKRFHLRFHCHEERTHLHPHYHDPEAAHEHRHGFSLRSLVIGMVHGLAGSAVLTLLVLTTLPSPLLGGAYILLFGLGSILGMMLFSGVIGLPFVFTASHMKKINGYLRIVAGAISIVFGLYLTIQVGLIQGLLWKL